MNHRTRSNLLAVALAAAIVAAVVTLSWALAPDSAAGQEADPVQVCEERTAADGRIVWAVFEVPAADVPDGATLCTAVYAACPPVPAGHEVLPGIPDDVAPDWSPTWGTADARFECLPTAPKVGACDSAAGGPCNPGCDEGPDAGTDEAAQAPPTTCAPTTTTTVPQPPELIPPLVIERPAPTSTTPAPAKAPAPLAFTG